MQVLFNTQPVSYTKSCTTSPPSDFESSVTPPGVTVAAGASLPAIVGSLPALSTWPASTQSLQSA